MTNFKSFQNLKTPYIPNYVPKSPIPLEVNFTAYCDNKKCTINPTWTNYTDQKWSYQTHLSKILLTSTQQRALDELNREQIVKPSVPEENGQLPIEASLIARKNAGEPVNSRFKKKRQNKKHNYKKLKSI
jgi:hypothetical protein